MFNIIVKLILLIVVTAKNCSCDDDENSDIKATINILPLMNKIIDLKKTTTTENSTMAVKTSTASTASTSSTISSTATAKLEITNSTSEEAFGSISLKSTNLTVSNLTENTIGSNETEQTGNTTVMTEITGEIQDKKAVKHSELKNCPWITWFGIAFGFIIVCWIIKCVSKYLNKRNARKNDACEPSDEIKSRIREAAIASASSHSVRKPLIQSPAEIHKSIKSTGTNSPKPRSKSPAKYPSKTL